MNGIVRVAVLGDDGWGLEGHGTNDTIDRMKFKLNKSRVGLILLIVGVMEVLKIKKGFYV